MSAYRMAAASQSDWSRLARRARRSRKGKALAMYIFMIAISLPIVLPYFWLVTIAFSARTGTVETTVLWRSVLVLVPALIGYWLVAILAKSRGRLLLGIGAVTVVASSAFITLIGPSLHLQNFI